MEDELTRRDPGVNRAWEQDQSGGGCSLGKAFEKWRGQFLESMLAQFLIH